MKSIVEFLKESDESTIVKRAELNAYNTKQPWVVVKVNNVYQCMKKSTFDSTGEKTRQKYELIKTIQPKDTPPADTGYQNPNDIAKTNKMNRYVELKNGDKGTLVFNYGNGSYAFKKDGDSWTSTRKVSKDDLKEHAGYEATNELTKKYRDETPGQKLEENYVVWKLQKSSSMSVKGGLERSPGWVISQYFDDEDDAKKYVDKQIKKENYKILPKGQYP